MRHGAGYVYHHGAAQVNALFARATVAGAVLVALAACSEIQLDERAPGGYEISGVWLLDEARSDAVPDLSKLPARNKQRLSSRQRAIDIALGSPLTFIAHDFQILGANRLDIEQNRDSMGVRYHPGVYRDVSWGQRQRGLWEVDAGWFEGDLVVRSSADGLLVMETFVAEASDRLLVEIYIEADDIEPVTYARRFERLSR